MSCVIVTGAAGGIGQALVRAYANAGHAVLGVDRGERRDDFAGEHYLACDLQRTVAEPGYAAQVFADLRAALGGRRLDTLVNNAAVQILGPVDRLGRDDWRTSLDVNLLAPFFWAQAFLPELEAAAGSVLNISSIHARLTKPGFVAYATSKAALSGMTRAMAVDLGPRVRVNAIEPAAIGTDMLKAGFEGNPDGYAQLEQCHPQGRIGTPEEVATLALALSHGGLRFVHGASLDINGGIGVRLHDPV